ncbi:MAG: DUF3592 domain-containing protein [Lachnospiraceae bacterium]|nr:DUF3592 domain-containing protein [Lachnospiraceae bacterium]
MSEYSKLFLYIPGILIFLAGSGQVRRFLALRRAEKKQEAFYGNVVQCTHVVKKDKKGRETFNYYNVVVEFTNGFGHKERQAVKSPSQYSVGQQLRILKEAGSSQYSLVPDENKQLFNPWQLMIGGALCVLLAYYTNQQMEVQAMVCLAAILLGAGLVLVTDSLMMKKKNLQVIDSEIIEVYVRQISKATKIIRGDKYTYYPIVRYELDGKENIRRCNINSSGAKTFKVGDHMKLYYDPASKAVLENRPNMVTLVIGIALAVTGLLAGISVFSVLV